MIFHLYLQTSGSEASSQLVGHGPQWAVESRIYYCHHDLTGNQEVLDSISGTFSKQNECYTGSIQSMTLEDLFE
jgi:hypothetical protein